MDKAGPVLLFGLGLVVVYFGAQHMWGLYYSRPRTFRYGEETFIWVPDEDSEDAPFFRKPYEHGSFQYADGTPVTDHRLHRMLQDVWVRQNRPSNDGD
jgi:hypothetical protein